MRYVASFHEHEGAPNMGLLEEVSPQEILNGIHDAGCALRDFAQSWGTVAPIDVGGSWADLYDASEWDGVSYGEPLTRLSFGQRDAIVRNDF
jgi:hypothetical protein